MIAFESKRERRQWVETLLSYDYLLMIAVVALSVFGIVMIYAATNTGFTTRLTGLHLNQRLYVVTGVLVMFAFAVIDYRFITRFYMLIYILCIGLLITAVIIGADEVTGTGRWIWLSLPGGRNISIQPSEFAKIFMILFLSKFIEVRKDNFNHILILLLILIFIAFPAYMVFRQPSLSASMVIISASLIVLFSGGLYYRTLFILLILVVPLVLVIWFDLKRNEPLFIQHVLKDYQLERVQTFNDPVPGSDEAMQIESSLYAIGSGGLQGKGFMNNGHVLVGHNDMIFSVIAEQFGFRGCAIILGLMGFIIIKCILIALRADDMQGRLIASGVAGMLIVETYMNVGVATGLLPVTGVAFPFLSYGGSIMWVHMIAIGIVLNIGLPRERSMFEKD